ncbi:tyrosine-type recombinase/integrase [Paraburkholderia phenoliruptrix]|uniref:tyrosine-type recombinase/integrase n=1 Tax=Paraburkholderia phenoliruptrix TaxID=252970 RepID=UPI0028589916|nr:tyrosine-type recombinase/integrase [Paraburkholderia phenoliruptrix]MDR6392612.1 integrase [Paraburkholderia phenoliruptrix]
MARLDYIRYDFYDASLAENGELVWAKQTDKAPIKRLPQIYWENHSGWDEVNAWALDRAASGTLDDETIKRTMKHLCRYADFTETEQLDWRHFPVRREQQVLRKFRKHLIEQRDEGALASSTVSNCMSTVIQFYRFADLHNLIGNSAPMWKNRLAVVPFHDTAGFKRTAVRLSSDLSIPNRRTIGARLEDGLLPLHADHMNQVVAYTATQKHATEELHLMLCTGFFTGARVGTVTTLTVTSLQTAREDPLTPSVFLLPVGPGTGIATKFSVKGDLMVPKAVLDDVKRYSLSTKRLLREAKARPEHKNLLFLTRTGRPYTVGTVDRLVQDMRRRAVKAGMRFMEYFKFHQSRATFGTWLLDVLLASGASPAEALGILRDAMLHKDESTSLGYVRFRTTNRAKQKAAIAFNEAFTGFRSRDWDSEDA